MLHSVAEFGKSRTYLEAKGAGYLKFELG